MVKHNLYFIILSFIVHVSNRFSVEDIIITSVIGWYNIVQIITLISKSL